MMDIAQQQRLKDFMSVLDVHGNGLLVVHRGEEIFRHFEGEASADTLFRVYSMTKVVTVTAALQLVERGMMTLNDPVSDYLPEYAHLTVWDDKAGKAVPAKNTLRIRDLFCMAGGFPYPGGGSETARRLAVISQNIHGRFGGSAPTREFVRAIAAAPLAFEPGTHWMYGLCHDILGAVIEVVSGQLFGEYLRDNIFKPLGMERTFFRCPEALKPLIARRHEDSIAPDADNGFFEPARYESGGGGLLSTADDFMKLARALTRRGLGENGVRILGSKTVDLLRMDWLNDTQKADFCWDYLAGYSYGLGVRTLIDPVKAGIPGSVGEFGWCGVLGTWVLMDPEEDLTVVYMHQRYPNLEKHVQTHLRSMIYAAI